MERRFGCGRIRLVGAEYRAARYDREAYRRRSSLSREARCICPRAAESHCDGHGGMDHSRVAYALPLRFRARMPHWRMGFAPLEGYAVKSSGPMNGPRLCRRPAAAATDTLRAIKCFSITLCLDALRLVFDTAA